MLTTLMDICCELVMLEVWKCMCHGLSSARLRSLERRNVGMVCGRRRRYEGDGQWETVCGRGYVGDGMWETVYGTSSSRNVGHPEWKAGSLYIQRLRLAVQTSVSVLHSTFRHTLLLFLPLFLSSFLPFLSCLSYVVIEASSSYLYCLICTLGL